MTDAIVILCTCSSQDEAVRIAEALVDARLAACVNILPQIQSTYRWEGKIERANEVLLLIKTTQDRFPSLQQRIAEQHSYEVPEIIALPIMDGSDKYLGWLREQV